MQPKTMLGSALGHDPSLELISSGPPGTFDLSKGQTYETPQRGGKKRGFPEPTKLGLPVIN